MTKRNSYWRIVRKVAEINGITRAQARTRLKTTYRKGKRLEIDWEGFFVPVRVLKNVKQVWHIKFVYKSDRGTSHDIMIEIEIVTVRSAPLSATDIAGIANTSEAVKQALDEYEQVTPYMKMEKPKLETEEDTDDEEENTDVKFDKGKDVFRKIR